MNNKLAFIKEYKELCKNYKVNINYNKKFILEDYDEESVNELVSDTCGKEIWELEQLKNMLEVSARHLEEDMYFILEKGRYGLIDGEIFDYEKGAVIREAFDDEIKIQNTIKLLYLKIKEIDKLL